MIAGSPDVAALTDIPIVDFAGFSSPDPAVRAATAASIRGAFETVGFLYLANHGVPQAVLDRVRAEAALFFARPLEQKQPLRWEGPGISTGYIGIAGQVHDQTRPYDLMEAYNAAHDLSGRQTFWPADRPEFRSAVTAYHDVARQAAERVLQAVAVAYGLPERYFSAFHDEYPRGRAHRLRHGHAAVPGRRRRPRDPARRRELAAGAADPRHRGGQRGRPHGALDQRPVPLDHAPRGEPGGRGGEAPALLAGVLLLAEPGGADRVSRALPGARAPGALPTRPGPRPREAAPRLDLPLA